MIIDIDNFKQINDIHGHIFGDEILKTFTGKLSGQIRVSDTIFPDDALSIDELLICADTAMYEAKKNKGIAFVEYKNIKDNIEKSVSDCLNIPD